MKIEDILGKVSFDL